MIDRKGFTKEALLAHIEKHLGKASLVQETKPIYYFGGGYWRGVDRFAPDGWFVGIELINPSLTAEQISIVEKAMWLLP